MSSKYGVIYGGVTEEHRTGRRCHRDHPGRPDHARTFFRENTDHACATMIQAEGRLPLTILRRAYGIYICGKVFKWLKSNRAVWKP